MNDKLTDALNEISDTHLQEAIQPKRKRRPYWLGAVAAVLAVVLLLAGTGFSFRGTLPGDQYTVTLSTEQRPIQSAVVSLSSAPRQSGSTALAGSAQTSAASFFQRSTRQFLAGTQENRVYSPAGAYMVLAMLAEMTGGATQEQLLETLGVSHIESLRSRVSALWESVYTGDGASAVCALANSAWLDDALSYDQGVMDTLGYDYYASVFQGDIGSDTVNEDIRAWLSNNTGGLLEDAVDTIGYDQSTVLALFSTIYFNGTWTAEFSAADNTVDLFYSPSGVQLATYMNDRRRMDLYWGDSFSAVALSMSNGCTMWLVLPDEDATVDMVLEDGAYLELATSGTKRNSHSYIINLSVPKFDAGSQYDLIGGLRELGITDIFDPALADFSPSVTVPGGLPVYINRVTQANRVVIDESGATAASFTEASGALGFNPNTQVEEIDFILDRPFLFVITSGNGLPLFTGVVNES